MSGPVWTTRFCCSCVPVCQLLDVCVLRYPYDPMMELHKKGQRDGLMVVGSFWIPA